jgi:hypothetical protein
VSRTCEACHTEIPPGNELGSVGDYALCEDMTGCLDRMYASSKSSDEKEDGGK